MEDKSGLFVSLGSMVIDMTNKLSSITAFSNELNMLKTFIVIVIGTTIVIQGYLTIAGKIQSPISDLIVDCLKKSILMTVIYNYNGWLLYIGKGLEGFYTWAGGGLGLYATLGDLHSAVVDGLTDAFVEDSALMAVVKTFIPVIGALDAVGRFLTLIICYFAFLFIIKDIFFALIGTTVSHTLLTLIFPLALCCRLFSMTKGIFDKWIELFLSNLFFLLVYTKFINISMNYISNFYSSQNFLNTNFVSLIGSCIMLTVTFAVAFKMVQHLSQSIVAVSIEMAAASAGSAALNTGVNRSKSFGGKALSGIMSKNNNGDKAVGMAADFAKGFVKGGVVGGVASVAFGALKRGVTKK